jgi:hypothetical protein
MSSPEITAENARFVASPIPASLSVARLYGWRQDYDAMVGRASDTPT